MQAKLACVLKEDDDVTAGVEHVRSPGEGGVAAEAGGQRGAPVRAVARGVGGAAGGRQAVLVRLPPQAPLRLQVRMMILIFSITIMTDIIITIIAGMIHKLACL